MNLADDLLEQARHLASRDQNKPRQANLRRAVSTAYYALFHLLIDEATGLLTNDREIRLQLTRVPKHTQMDKCCKVFVNSKSLAEPYRTIMAPPIVPTDLAVVAQAFVDLQPERHAADYDRRRAFHRQEVLDLIDKAQTAFQAWQRVRVTQPARVFLFALFFHENWNR